MTEVLAPTRADQVRDAVRWAGDTETVLAVRGAGSKAGMGRPVAAGAVLDVSALRGVSLYEPEELVIRLAPGTPMTEAAALLAERGQMLAFEPPDFGPLFGAPAGAGTVGGAVSVNAAGPRRFRAGAARDHVLGVKGVSGFGEAFSSGGRVVKNVSGYDLCKLVTGSYGTLAALTEVTLKVAPRPEAETTLVVRGLSIGEAAHVMGKAAASPTEPSGVAYLPALVAAAAPAPASGEPVLAVRFEGARAGLAERRAALRRRIVAPADVLVDEDSAALWRAIRDVAPLGPPHDVALWRASVPPADVAAVVARNAKDFWFADWAGGLVWLARPSPPSLRGGGFVRVRAPDGLEGRLPFVSQPDGALRALLARVKASFDPKGVLNRGRLYEGV